MADVRSLFRQVLHLDETPHRTALAFAIGIFIGFSPAYGLHMVMVGILRLGIRAGTSWRCSPAHSSTIPGR
jgi:uncharacterized protein (DUF2062 family)